MRRWNSRTMATTGMVTTTDAAAMAVVGCSNWDSPVKNARAAGTGRARLVEVSEMPKTKSFQQKKNVRIAAVNTPGAASDTTGNIAIARAKLRIHLFPGNSSRAIA